MTRSKCQVATCSERIYHSMCATTHWNPASPEGRMYAGVLYEFSESLGRAPSSLAAMRLTFFSSLPFIPKKVAI